MGQMTCKPGFVQGLLPSAIIPLGRPLLDGSRNLPERSGAVMPCSGEPVARRSYLVLLRTRLAMPSPLPETRCALTAPFHPYPGKPRRSALCGAISGVTPGGRYPPSYYRGARTFLKAGFPAPRSPGHLARRSSSSLLQLDQWGNDQGQPTEDGDAAANRREAR